MLRVTKWFWVHNKIRGRGRAYKKTWSLWEVYMMKFVYLGVMVLCGANRVCRIACCCKAWVSLRTRCHPPAGLTRDAMGMHYSLSWSPESPSQAPLTSLPSCLLLLPWPTPPTQYRIPLSCNSCWAQDTLCLFSLKLLNPGKVTVAPAFLRPGHLSEKFTSLLLMPVTLHTYSKPFACWKTLP